jgi:hypothetical protein
MIRHIVGTGIPITHLEGKIIREIVVTGKGMTKILTQICEYWRASVTKIDHKFVGGGDELNQVNDVKY